MMKSLFSLSRSFFLSLSLSLSSVCLFLRVCVWRVFCLGHCGFFGAPCGYSFIHERVAWHSRAKVVAVVWVCGCFALWVHGLWVFVCVALWVCAFVCGWVCRLVARGAWT